MCLCHHRSPVARDSSRAFASLSTFNFGLLTSFSPTLSHTSEKSPASSKYCHTSKTPSRNSFTIRTSMPPLPQPLYNPHLQAPLGSAGNKGLITPLESALTENSPVSLLESALTEMWGVGGSGYPGLHFALRRNVVDFRHRRCSYGMFFRYLPHIQDPLACFAV